jgi:glycine C-acetyltransferase
MSDRQAGLTGGHPGPAGRPDPLAFLDDEVAALRERHLYRRLRVMSSAQGPIVSVDGRRLISLSSNDYLGLTHHPRLREAALAAVRDFGVGSGAVRTIAGTMTMHEELEAELSAFKGTPAVLTFQSGFTANTGVLPVVTGETDLIVSDALNHASIIDGMRLSKAPRQIYPHADVEALRTILGEARETGRPGGGQYRLILVVTDGVFSMDGDIAPLPGIVEAAESFGAAVMVDDAHASGVLGRNGRGSVDHFGLHGRVAIQVGTLSKAVGSLGGYVAGSLALREILTQRARPFLFSTSHPPAVVAACREAIRVMEEEPELQDRLWANTRRFKAELTRLGFDTGRSETPITPVMMGDPDLAGRFSDRLLEEGVFAQPVVFPTVAIDKSRLRTIVTAAHADEQLDAALAAFDRVGRELGLISG